jgi:hypothetical protein
MPRASTLSAKQITSAAKKSVDRVLRQNGLKPLRPIIVGFVPPWWWCGFILRDPDIWTIQAAEKVAVDVHRGISAGVPGIKGGKPGVLTTGGITTIGFAPPIDIQGIVE